MGDYRQISEKSSVYSELAYRVAQKKITTELSVNRIKSHPSFHHSPKLVKRPTCESSTIGYKGSSAVTLNSVVVEYNV